MILVAKKLASCIVKLHERLEVKQCTLPIFAGLMKWQNFFWWKKRKKTKFGGFNPDSGKLPKTWFPSLLPFSSKLVRSSSSCYDLSFS